MLTITQVKTILDRKFGGASIDDIQGISDFSLFREAAANFLNELSPAETVRHTTVEVFQDVFDYNPAVDTKELVDFRTQSAVRPNTNNPTRRFIENFDQLKANNNEDFSLEWQDASKLLRYSKSISGNIGVHNMDNLTANGTWDGTAANIALSKNNPFKGSGSIIADYDTGEYIENNDMTAVDLSDHKNKSTLFVAGYLPDASFLTSLNLLWGSSTANYFSQDVTAPQFGSFKTGWNLIPFAWNGATETGTVDTENINYVRITPTLSTSDTDIKFDNIFSALGKIQDIVYYSNYLFRNTSGTWLEVPTADTDIVNLDTTGVNLFVYECIRLAALQLQGQGSVYQTYTDLLYGTGQQVGQYDRYKKRNPEEMIQPQGSYRTFKYTKK